MQMTDSEAIYTLEEWDALCLCGVCGRRLDDPCARVMHQDDCSAALAVEAGEAQSPDSGPLVSERKA
jgi:hypothetical protein